MGQTEAEAGTVLINEVLASNATGWEDADGDTEDWIELLNTGDTDVALEGFGLSDDYDNPYRWVIPDVTIGPGEFLLIWASGKDRDDPGEELHTNFRIASAGEEVLLTDPDGARIDEIAPTRIPTDISYGRKPDGADNWVFFSEPTPGASNGTNGYSRVLERPELSHAPGFYTEPIELAASHPFEETVLRYTLDGSEPKESSPEFPVSLSVDSRAGESNVFSEIQTTHPNDTSQIAGTWAPPGYPVDKGTIVRVRAFADDAIPSRTVTATYFADAELADKYTLPVVSVVVEPDDFFSPEKGIYVPGPNAVMSANYLQRGREWERPVHVEFFDEHGTLFLNQDAGTRIHGGGTRRGPFKSLRLYARNAYGESYFNYPFFADVPDDAYKRLMLRNSGQDQWLTYIRDAMIQELVSHMRFDTQAYKPFIKFLNGEYWGIFNLRERYDKHYLARQYGVDPDNLDILEANHHQQSDLLVKEGSADHYEATLDYIDTHGVQDSEHYEYIRTRIDTKNYADYLVAMIYANSVDWPGNNIDYWRVRTEEYEPEAPHGHDGRWRWLMFDLDDAYWRHVNNSLYHYSHDTLAFATGAKSGNWATQPYATFLPRKMLESETFRNKFVNRMCDQLNTAFRPHRIIAIIDEMKAVIEPEIEEHMNRHHRPEGGMPAWRHEVDRMRQFAEERPPHQYNHMVSYFDLPGLADVTLNVSDSRGGHIRINSITIDTGTLGLTDPAQPYPWTGTYVQEVPMEIEATAHDGYIFVGWDGLTNETPLVEFDGLDADIAVTALFEPDPDRVATTLSFEWAAPPTQSGPLPDLIVHAVNDENLIDPSYTGEVTVALNSGEGLQGSMTVHAVDGVAVFNDLYLEGAGVYSFTITTDVDELVTEEESVLQLTEILLPRFIQGEQDVDGNNFNRVPYAFRVRIEGLIPDGTYRYGNRVVSSDDPPEQSGAGNMIIVDEDDSPFIRNTDAPAFSPDELNKRHGEFMADAEGTYTGWFVTEPTGNRRFVPGDSLQMRLILNDGAGGTNTHRMLTTTGSVDIIEFGAQAEQGSGIMGPATNSSRHFLILYDDPAGEGRPLAATPIERTGSEVDERYAGFYESVVVTQPQFWGTIIPNSLTGGVKRVETRSLENGQLIHAEVYDAGIPGTMSASNGLQSLLVGYDTEHPVLLANRDARWAEDFNWAHGVYPDGTGAVAIVHEPLDGNRNVELGASVTLGDLTIDLPDDSVRNRIQDETGEAGLRFAGSNGVASISVPQEDGAGFVEFRIGGGVYMESDLELLVNGTPGHHEYGALRLRRSWTGPGALIKKGPGTVSLTGSAKTYTGETRIEEGIMRVTEPAAPTSSTQLVVRAGGQLRLISGNAPRTYAFGGPLHIEGTGLSGFPASGALRYEPGSTGNYAEITSEVVLDGESVLHVEGAGNTLALQGVLGGADHLIKTGAGRLRWAGDAAHYTGDLSIEEGKVELAGDLPVPTFVGVNTRLTGWGRVGALQGAGEISLADTILEADSVNGLHYAFSVGATGPPDYGNATDAGNAVLRLRGAEPFGSNFNPMNTVRLYFDLHAFDSNDVFRAGFFTDRQEDFMAAMTNATFEYYVADPSGDTWIDGAFYSAYNGPLTPVVDTVPDIAVFDSGRVTGRVMRIRFAEGQLPYEGWLARNFDPEELANPSISGPTADPQGDGMPNLARYALGLDLNDPPETGVPVIEPVGTGETSYIDYAYRRLLHEERSVLYRVEYAHELDAGWSAIETLPGVQWPTPEPSGDGLTEIVRVRIPVTGTKEALFLRLRIIAWD